MKLIFLPPRNWNYTKNESDEKTDRFLAFRYFEKKNVTFEILDPFTKPLNPFSNGNPFICGLDLLRALRVLLLRRNVDAVVSIFESSGFFILLLRNLFFFKPKVILWDASTGNTWKLLKIIQSIVFPRYDGFMMLTSYQKQYLINKFSITVPISLIYYNINEKFFTRTGKYNNDGYLLSVGDDISRDFQTVLGATEDLEYRLVIKSKWRPMHPALRITPVEYISDRLSDIDFRQLYLNSNIVIISLFKVDSAGGITTLFEAMAMGKAIIISESSLTTDFVENEINCLVVPPQDVDALRQAIHRLLKSKELQLKLGENARRMIECQFSSNDLASRIVTSISSIINK